MTFTDKFNLLNTLYVRFGCQSFVETGTFEAAMTVRMSSVSNVVRSIEISEILYERSLNNVAAQAANRNIKLHCGDSVHVLPSILADDDIQRPLVWLDAHFSGGFTMMGASETPILTELHIVSQCNKLCVVAIDDLRCFNGTHDYPTVEFLKRTILALWKNVSINTNDDILWFYTA